MAVFRCLGSRGGDGLCVGLVTEQADAAAIDCRVEGVVDVPGFHLGDIDAFDFKLERLQGLVELDAGELAAVFGIREHDRHSTFAIEPFLGEIRLRSDGGRSGGDGCAGLGCGRHDIVSFLLPLF